MDEKQTQLVIRLLTERIWQLRNTIREQESLSVPCPPDRWRWADVKTGGYGRKPADELAADRARAVQRAADARDELAVALSARQALSSVPA
jgi:hypothetical protein